MIKKISDHSVLTTLINKDSVILDLGAHKGDFTRAIKNLYNCNCYLVEADNELVEYLISHFKNEHILCAAVTGRDELSPFIIRSNRQASSLYHSKDKNRLMGDIKDIQTVNCVSLNTILQHFQLSHVDLLKIDIEGAEIALLNATDDSILQSINQISLEFHDHEKFAYNLSAQTNSCISRLKSLGFYYADFNIERHRDCLFVNKNKTKYGFLYWNYIRVSNELLPKLKIRLTMYIALRTRIKRIKDFF